MSSFEALKNKYSPAIQWARDNGYEVNERGRVPGSILEAFDKAQAA